MHVISIDDLCIGETYFIVYEGLVYLAECDGDEVPETFCVNTHIFDKYICDVIHTSLIFKL